MDNQHVLRVAGTTGADLLVRRVRSDSALVADGRSVNAGDSPELLLRAPEAAHAEVKAFGALRVGALYQRPEHKMLGGQFKLALGTPRKGIFRSHHAGLGS